MLKLGGATRLPLSGLLDLALAGQGPPPLPLGIDLTSEGVLVSERDLVDDVNPGGDKEASRLPVEQGGAKEAAGGAPVHGRVGDAEGEARDHGVHEDAEVVAQEGARDAQGPGRADDEHVARRQQAVGEPLDRGLVG